MTMTILLSLLASASTGLSDPAPASLFDFGDPRSLQDWVPVNDAVMGGLSSGRIAASNAGTALFTGTVTLENNGGFASVRTRARNHDLRGFDGIELRVRGDGKRYKINLKNDPYLDGALYRAAFDTTAGAWTTVRIPFDEFVPTFRGRQLRNHRALDLAHVMSFGLMISDKQTGPFRLELAEIAPFSNGTR